VSDKIETSKLVAALLATLIQYRCSLIDHKARQSEQSKAIRSRANVLLGQVYDDLLELGVSRHFTQYGCVMPIFETALQTITPTNQKIVFGALTLAIEEMERIDGKLKRQLLQIEQSRPQRKVKRPNKLSAETTSVFLVHGRDIKLRETVARTGTCQ